MSDNNNTKLTPPYLPYSTFTSFFGELKGGIPSRIDRSFLSNKSGTIQTYLLSTLKFFDLIDDEGVPTTKLKKMVEAGDEQRKGMIGDLVREYYPDLFDGSIDLESTTQAQVDEKFSDLYGVQGDTRRKVITFFTLAAKDASITLSPHLKKTRKRSPGSGRGKKKGSGKQNNELPPLPPPSTDTRGIPALEEKLVIGLIEKLPAPGASFPQEEQQLWIDMAQMVFKMVYRDTGKAE